MQNFLLSAIGLGSFTPRETPFGEDMFDLAGPELRAPPAAIPALTPLEQNFMNNTVAAIATCLGVGPSQAAVAPITRRVFQCTINQLQTITYTQLNAIRNIGGVIVTKQRLCFSAKPEGCLVVEFANQNKSHYVPPRDEAGPSTPRIRTKRKIACSSVAIEGLSVEDWIKKRSPNIDQEDLVNVKLVFSVVNGPERDAPADMVYSLEDRKTSYEVSFRGYPEIPDSFLDAIAERIPVACEEITVNFVEQGRVLVLVNKAAHKTESIWHSS